jgi:hypothetical protein
MEAILIARFKTKREANRISRLIEQHSKPVRSNTGTNLEDMYLGEMIEEGMREKRDHPIAAFKQYLNKRIAKLSK